MEPCGKEAEIASLKSDIRTIFKRIDEQLSLAQAVYELVGEVKVMNIKLQSMNETQEQLKKDVEQLKAQPGNRWNEIVKTVLASLAGGLAAYLLLRLGLK